MIDDDDVGWVAIVEAGDGGAVDDFDVAGSAIGIRIVELSGGKGPRFSALETRGGPSVGNRRIAPRWIWNAKSIKPVRKLRPTKRRLQTMNSDQIQGNWKQFVGKAKEKWGRLTDDDWKVVEGKRDQLVGKIQERYGIGREEAERQLRELERT